MRHSACSPRAHHRRAARLGGVNGGITSSTRWRNPAARRPRRARARHRGRAHRGNPERPERSVGAHGRAAMAGWREPRARVSSVRSAMRPWIAVSGALIAAGVALFLYKTLILGYPLSTAEVPGTWRVDFVVTVTGKGSRTVVGIPLPRPSGYQRLLTEEVKSDQMRFSITEADGDRRGRWSGRLDGSASLTYQVTFDAAPYGRPIPASDAGGGYPKSVSV